MDDSETYMNVNFTKTDSRFPSRGNIGSERPTRRDRSVASIWLICVLTTALVITGICWWIHDQPCSKHWIRNKDRCYYVSTVDTSSFRAMQECSNSDSRLLEINSRDEANFVSRKLVDGDRSYWIGKCENWNVALAILYKVSSVTSDCKDCYSYPGSYPCNRDRRFICEKSAPLLPEIPERIHNLCQQPMETT
ncbi:C-type lectin domain family 7 member A-like isoform X2 [Mobula birostris]|uniref:C-type lectin domain family 7 member A-like isoform X2 n=1 Tax=Mobula birostris TaxID=1983395 RepID=UPI003B28BBB1